jgi:hypothetical protein
MAVPSESGLMRTIIKQSDIERRGNMRNNKAVAEMIICDQEFRRVIQAMPVRELQLPLWDTAKAEGRVLQ